MTDEPLFRPLNKENAFKDLIARNYPNLDDYNTENPPPVNIEKAEALAERDHDLRVWKTLAFFAAFCAFLSVLIIHPAFAVLLIIVALGVAGAIDSKRDKGVSREIDYLRKPFQMPVVQHACSHSCLGVSLVVTLMYETPSDEYSSASLLINTLNIELGLRLQKYFDRVNFKFKNDPSTASECIEELIDVNRLASMFEGLLLPEIVDICHDFKPRVFRYTVTVRITSDSEQGMPIGKQWNPDQKNT